MNKLFGTDGIRAKAGVFPLDEASLRVLGSALVERFIELEGGLPRFVSGMDTRESGPWMEAAIHSGIKNGGGHADSAGVITTPGVAYLTAKDNYDAGIVISASHNPYQDNGVKIFLPNGRKLDAESEAFLERKLHNARDDAFESLEVSRAKADSLQREYLDHFFQDFSGLDISNVKIVADCANGAASHLAPRLFSELGARAEVIFADPDGRNINEQCGSLHLESLCKRVIEKGADFGVAFDGDADRALFVDESGEVVDGDAILWIMANHLWEQGLLNGEVVVATVMSNVGLEIALGSIGVKLLRTSVGDKYVLEELIRTGASLGGEQSGHIIFPFRSLVGDGIQTALFLLRAMNSSDRSLRDLKSGFTAYPQILVNIKVKEKVPFENIKGVPEIVQGVEEVLNGTGRLLLRYSGTENLARVMIEGVDQTEIERLAAKLAAGIEQEIGK